MKQPVLIGILGACLLPLAPAQAQHVGIGTTTPAYPLDVNGTIRATTAQGIVLDAQDRPLITRGWDAFASGIYTGLGRWGLYMEPSSLNFGIPTTNAFSKRFQWVTYDDNSSIGLRLMSLYSYGYLGLGDYGVSGFPTTRLDIVSEAGGGADDVLLHSYGTANDPGLGMRRYRGTRAAPANLQAGDMLGEVGLSGYYNNQENLFTQSGLRARYQGDGTTALSDLRLVTSGAERLTIDPTGKVGIGLGAPAYPLDVNGTIHANTSQGVALDAQDRPIITRGWDPFTSGNYTGLGRWGMFMEPSNLTFGVPVMGGRQFQWVRYNLNSSVDAQLMVLTQEGRLGMGIGSPDATVHIARGTGTLGTLGLEGTTYASYINYGPNEDTYLRGGKAGSNLYLNAQTGGGVAVGNNVLTPGEMLDVNGTTRTTEVHTPNTGTNNMVAMAYGQVNSLGSTITNSSGNVILSYIGAGHYRLTFTGFGSYAFNTTPVSLTLNGSTAGFITSDGAGGAGTLDVYTYLSNGNTAADRSFNFVVFKP